MVEAVSGKRTFLVRYQYGYKKDMTLNQLTAVIVSRIPVKEEADATAISTKPKEEVDLEKG